ncbi:hypothetical protein T459_08201 [Capsicum annuum]|uniref:Uncharacterized protein n=1 Tax=Capsicum annuum TaxID=4072 RepID=A0A2G2ZVV0_CAPAN|nr:hypothetical protein T459_08201 [Capsicum annuum]
MTERHWDLPNSQIPPDFPDAQVRKLQASKEKAPAKRERKKSSVLRKEMDSHYRVNASGLGFRQLNFVIAYPQSKNLFYLMSERKTCWNNEGLWRICVCLYRNIKRRTTSSFMWVDSACQRACYASLLWHYGVEKTNEGYTSDNGDLPRPKKNVIEEIEANAIVTLE